MADESPRFPRCCSARCLAWALGGTNPKTVIRAGFGFFYQRFDLINLLIATRYDGIAQQQYMVSNPDFFPMIPDIPSLTGSQQTIEKVNPRLRAPHLLNSAIALALKDLPWQGSTVQMRLEVRRFRCDYRDCIGVTFAESLPLVARKYGRQTNRLSETSRLIGFDWLYSGR